MHKPRLPNTATSLPAFTLICTREASFAVAPRLRTAADAAQAAGRISPKLSRLPSRKHSRRLHLLESPLTPSCRPLPPQTAPPLPAFSLLCTRARGFFSFSLNLLSKKSDPPGFSSHFFPLSSRATARRSPRRANRARTKPKQRHYPLCNTPTGGCRGRSPCSRAHNLASPHPGVLGAEPLLAGAQPRLPPPGGARGRSPLSNGRE